MQCFYVDMEIVLTTGCNMKIKYGMHWHWEYLVTTSAIHMLSLSLKGLPNHSKLTNFETANGFTAFESIT